MNQNLAKIEKTLRIKPIPKKVINNQTRKINNKINNKENEIAQKPTIKKKSIKTTKLPDIKNSKDYELKTETQKKKFEPRAPFLHNTVIFSKMVFGVFKKIMLNISNY